MPDGVGRRIARARKLRGFTQQQLADRVPCSKSLIAQVERGHKPASQALVSGVARALRVGVGDLTGQPYRGETAREDLVHACVPDLRRSLLTWDLPDDEVRPRPLSELEAPPPSTNTRWTRASWPPIVGFTWPSSPTSAAVCPAIACPVRPRSTGPTAPNPARPSGSASTSPFARPSPSSSNSRAPLPRAAKSAARPLVGDTASRTRAGRPGGHIGPGGRHVRRPTRPKVSAPVGRASFGGE
ncbi:helix-turn-helix domain-containing protein [Actinomadura gamaensis]|uniref:Helix-turn-helix domain-containing protein n=1 Tax=Actinomadura gamaensis TaxID=1763541 RepID=A0ABV9UA70_9ACTN